ncbi:MAG: hypothetical protein DWQ47_01190 [Acidobacteria bacterium]|nr:MAG: hypothetical protein DWQ32_11650 [Acidobacteriota bacterium]REK04116.1 MAG: hypothetical protein DWQ38_01175 [Acidobacteriota bacterium]REK15278.1 MAG: hypothetical protein DWQ43_17340 [Acidobacteriota bacterium]REK46368.1 MAG: hypothetical protein DWQ47_01190 [Acidobacteriota bacterium]
MIVPKLHDRLLLGGTLAGALGVVLMRGTEGSLSRAGTYIVIGGMVSVLAGVVLKLTRGR